MRRLALLLALACSALAATAGPAAAATSECNGFMVCVPVAGPWVVVPAARAVPRQAVEFELTCPKGFVVGGLDAELGDRAIDVSFLGTLGSPVNPGISTSRSVVFVGTYVGASAAAPTFRPHAGCIPASGGGGGRVQTAVGPVKPGKPTVRRVTTADVPAPGKRHVVRGCAAGERLVSGSHALGIFGPGPPAPALVTAASATQRIRGDSVVVDAAARPALRGTRVVVQVSAVCAGGR